MDPLIPSPLPSSGPKPTSQADRDLAQADAAKHTAKSVAVFAGVSLFFQQAVKPSRPHLADFVSKDIASLPSSRPGEAVRALPRPGISTLLYLLPPPIGVTPPEVYGIRPDFMVRNGEAAGPEYYALMKALGAVPEKSRVDYFRQREADQFEADTRERIKNYPSEWVVAQYNDYSRPGRQEQLPGIRVDRVLDIIRDELASRQATYTPQGTDLALPHPTIGTPTVIPSVLPAIPPQVVSVGGGGDYGGGGGDPLVQAVAANGSGPRGNADPLQAVGVSPTNAQQTPGIPNALQQEANRRAPPLLRELLTERSDP